MKRQSLRAIGVVASALLMQNGHAEPPASARKPMRVSAQPTLASHHRPPASSKVKLSATGLAAQRDIDPALNGSIRSRNEWPVAVAMQAAAEAARKDQDPSVNGFAGDMLLPQLDANLHAAATAARRDTDPGLNGSVLASLVPGAAPSGRSNLDVAWDAYERCHWGEAFDAFATLADAGDLEAARMALSMVLHGPALYQQTFDISLERLSSWRRLDGTLATANGPLSGPAISRTQR